MDYRFNYGMLMEWMNANPQFTKTHIARSLGFTDQASMTKWISGDRALPTEHLLKFCNIFQVPLEKFFFDHDATAVMNIRRPSINDQTEPNGGYTPKNIKGGPHRPSPITSLRIPSVVPGGVREEHTETHNEDTERIKSEQNAATPLQTTDMTQLFMAYQQALADMQREHMKREDAIRERYEHKWDKERDELMTIIRSQREEMETQKRRNYRYGMVGEEDS